MWCQTQQCLLEQLFACYSLEFFLIEPGKLFEIFGSLGKDVVRYVSVISLTHSGNTTESLMSGDDVLVVVIECILFGLHSCAV